MVKIKSPSAKKSGIFIGVTVAIFILGFATVYFYIKYQGAQKLLKNPTVAAKEEEKSLISQVGKLMVLPNETPTIATVSDKTKLVDQPFFTSSENGDKVLVYSNAKKAVLYRPSINKLIEVAPLNLGQIQPEKTNTTPTPTVDVVSVTILNGSKTAQAAKTAEGKLTLDPTFGKSIKVVLTGNAKSDYKNSVIVDVTGKNKNLVAQIGKSIGAAVGSLPEAEDKPASEILLIIGEE